MLACTTESNSPIQFFFRPKTLEIFLSDHCCKLSPKLSPTIATKKEERKKERRRRNKPVPTTLAPPLVNFFTSSLDTCRNAFLLLFFFPAAPPPPPHVYSSSLWHPSHPYTCEVGGLGFQAMVTSNPSAKVQVQNPLLLSLLYNCC